MDGSALPVDPAGLSCLGDTGSASCWEPGALQPATSGQSSGHWVVLHQDPGSPRALTTVATEPGHSFVLPAEMFSDKACVQFPDVGEAWSQ